MTPKLKGDFDPFPGGFRTQDHFHSICNSILQLTWKIWPGVASGGLLVPWEGRVHRLPGIITIAEKKSILIRWSPRGRCISPPITIEQQNNRINFLFQVEISNIENFEKISKVRNLEIFSEVRIFFRQNIFNISKNVTKNVTHTHTHTQTQ